MTSPEDLRRLSAESRARLEAVGGLRERNALIARASRRRLEAGRELLDRCRDPVQV